TIETQDPDNDGFNNLQEWTLDGNPTNTTPAVKLEWDSGINLKLQNTSLTRWYQLLQNTNLMSGTWQPIIQLQGTGSNLLFNLTTDRSQMPNAFYRLEVKVY
ncbi:MAG: hypothetical protein ACREFE_12750, partial [Limisphaerales bacterium]